MGNEDLVFLEVFPVDTYQDISAAEWLAHTPFRLTDEHINTGEEFLREILKEKSSSGRSNGSANQHMKISDENDSMEMRKHHNASSVDRELPYEEVFRFGGDSDDRLNGGSGRSRSAS
jgi:hypothetical protein